jgi:tetratricopeptide (TPR) repeat protein
MALSIGLGTSIWQWREATRQRTVAVNMLANAEATLDFTRSVLTEGIRSDETVTIAELLSRSEEIVAKLAQNNSRALAFAADFLAGWYLTFDQADKAEKLLTRTIDALPADARALATSSLICTRASAWAQLGRMDEAIAAATAEIKRNSSDAAMAAYCLQTRAELAIGVNDAKGALQYAQAALRSYNTAGQRSSRDKSVLLADVGYAYSLNGKADLAQTYYRQSFELLERTGHVESHDAAVVLNNWGIATIEIGNPLHALRLFDQAVAITRRRSPVGDPDPSSIANLAAALRTLARYPEAAAAYDTQLRMARLDGNAVGEAYALVGGARVATKLGQFDQAQQFLDAAATKTREGQIPAGSPGSLMQKVALGQLWAAQGRAADGTAMLTDAIDSYKKLGCCHAAKALALISRAEISLALAHLDPAAADAMSALEIAQGAQGTAPFSNATGSAWLMLGRVRQAQGRFAEARRAYELATKHLVNTLGEQHPDTLRARQGVADIA